MHFYKQLLHIASISPFLFAMVMNEITKDIRKESVKELLYADDLVLFGRKKIYTMEKRYDGKRFPKKCGKTKAF